MSLIKIVAFLLIFLYVLPFMTAICCFFHLFRHIFFAAMVFFTSSDYSIHIYSLPYWKGTSRGYAFSAVYLFAVPLLLSTLILPKYKVKLFPPGFFFYFLYFLAALISGVNAIHMHPWGFEICKMVWMYVIFLAAFNYLNNCKDLRFFICVISIILIYVFLIGLKQKYIHGLLQVRSTFPHQNSLSLYLELFGLLLLGVLMNERMSKLMFLLVSAGFSCAVLLILFTFSRGGFVVFFGGVAMVCALSIFFNGFSSRRLLLMLFGLTFLLSVVGYALPRVILRFTKAPESSKNTRISLALAARRIANDYRLGVGANNYAEFSGGGGKYDYSRELYLYGYPELGGIVETIYLLVAAECGWYGLGILIMWFLYYYLSAMISMFVLRKIPCSGITIGLFVGLTCNYWHSTLEWSLKQPNNFAQQMILYALIGVIAVNRKNIKAAYMREQEKKQQEEQLQAQLKAQLREQLKKQSRASVPEPKPVQPLNA